MRASDDSTIPSRSWLMRLIRPWEYQHLHAVANVRFAAGGFQLGIGLVLLSLGRSAGTEQERRKMYRLSAWFLVPAALNFLGGYLDTIAARTAPPRT
jgi:low temperature requirement protein LtrA